MSTKPSEITHLSPTSSISTAMKVWQIYLLDQNKSEYTIKAFMGDLGLLIQYLPPDVTLGDITSQDLNQFIDWLDNGRGKNIPCSPKSLSRRITTLKSFFRWLFEHGRIPTDPADSIVQQTVISPLPMALNSIELEKVIKAAQKSRTAAKPDARPLALLKLLLETGIKKSECLNLKCTHFVETNGTHFLFVRYPDQRDRNKERKIHLSAEFIEVFHEYLNQYAPAEIAFPWSPRRLEYLLEDIGNTAGIEKHLSFSMCRWNSALIDWKNDIEKNTIRQKLGISKIQWREIKMKLQELARTID